MEDRPEDFSAVVGKHWKGAVAYLLASRQPCLRIRDDEIANIGSNRNLVALAPGQLDRIKKDRTWILGVIVCPGDDIGGLVEWVKSARVASGRVWFFLHASADMGLLQPWEDAGFATDQVDVVASWDELHPIFGLMLSDQIYEEHAPRPKLRSWTPGRKPGKKA